VFTIDASVWVNADSPTEPHQPDSRALLDLLFARGLPIFIPTLLPAELAGAIARTRGDSALAEEMAKAILSLSGIRWIALDDALAQRATELAARHRLRGADSVYAAVALLHGCELVSLDREHLTRLTAVVPTLTPAEALARLRALGTK
jgi:predicted nucleic acid-binding protein